MVRHVLAFWTVLMGLLPVVAVAQPQAQEGGPSRAMIVRLKPLAREGRLLSGAEQEVRRQRLSRLAVSAGYTGSMGWRSVGGDMAVMKTPSTLKPEVARKVMAKMLATGEIEWAEPSVRQKLLAVIPPNDTYYGYSDDQGQWWARAAVGSNADPKALRQRGAPNINVAWNTTTGQTQANGTVVAVLDTGFLPHPDINPAQVLSGYDFVSDTRYDRDATPGRDSDPTDPGDWVTSTQANLAAFKEQDCEATSSSWHGLSVAGIVAAQVNNNAGMAGVNWATRLLPIRVAGMCGADMVDIIDAMRWAAGLSSAGGVANPTQAKVINVSFGSKEPCGPAYQAVINELRTAGVVVVAAAGNEHHGVARPANCQNVVSVAALNREGFKSTYSNFGPEVTVSTVGGDPGPGWGATDGGAWGAPLQDAGILTLHNTGATTAQGGGDYRNYAGTSFSAPITAGVVALMLDANPNLTPDEIIAGLQASARPHVQSNMMGTCSSSNPGRCICTTSTCGQGILDAGEAVQYALAKVTASPYVRPTLLAENIDSAEVSTALSLASADRPPNPTVTDSTPAKSGGGGGGGGAFDPVSLVVSALFAAALVLSRRSRCLAAV